MSTNENQVTNNNTQYIFISGDGSGAGKTFIALGILHSLLQRGYKANEIAYIKPATQCESVQMIWKYTEYQGIEHVDINAPVIYYAGYTHDVIDGVIQESIQQRRERVKQSILKLSEGKRFVVIDGVGYPAVGSCVGLSNADVASIVHAPVLLVGKSGVGNAIDSMIYTYTFYACHHIHVLGGVWNKLGASTYHTVEDTKKYTTKFFTERFESPHPFHVYGHIPLIERRKAESSKHQQHQTSAGQTPGDEMACRRKMANNSDELKWKDDEEEYVENFIKSFDSNVNADLLFNDLNAYWNKIYGHHSADHYHR